MSLRSGDVVAIEALLRWQDSTRGVLGPKAFLPLVAQTSAMVALGQWVLEDACSEAARWEVERPAGGAPVTLSVNVAAEEVLEAGFVDGVRLILQERALPTTMLQLEIDASDPLRSETLVSTRLQQLRDEGVRLAIDGASPLLGSGSAGVDADSVHLQRRWVRGVAGDAGVAASVASLVGAGPPVGRHRVRDGHRGARAGRRARLARLRPRPGLPVLRPGAGRRARVARHLAGGGTRRVAGDRDPVEHTVGVAEVAHPDVKGRPVVPHHHVAGRPAVPVGELRGRRPLVEQREQRIALGPGQPDEPRGEGRVHEQAPPPGLGVDPHDRVDDGLQHGEPAAVPLPALGQLAEEAPRTRRVRRGRRRARRRAVAAVR